MVLLVYRRTTGPKSGQCAHSEGRPASGNYDHSIDIDMNPNLINRISNHSIERSDSLGRPGAQVSRGPPRPAGPGRVTRRRRSLRDTRESQPVGRLAVNAAASQPTRNSSPSLPRHH